MAQRDYFGLGKCLKKGIYLKISKKRKMNLRIHGDNIIECERALQLVALAYNAEILRESTCVYLPVFSVEKNGKRLFEVELFAGHDRWNVSIAKILVEYGAPLREATDAYITKIIPQNQEQSHSPTCE